MNKANLKSYAPQARLDFIAAVTARANLLGITSAGALPAEVRGDVAIIDGREWPAKISTLRDKLVARIKRSGFASFMEEAAYTWFNRFAALRFLEIHDYLDHGWRVLSSRDGGLPEILGHAHEVALSGLSQDRAREMQLAGNQDNELYKLLLVSQCNDLSKSMPFLFEQIDDETELLLPENLLLTDSIVSKMIAGVPEDDWLQIEAIGWLYQFYISEKKDQVIGKVVRSEDIPAATQLFTPNWIVRYLVQNSLGRLWAKANPSSALKDQLSHYVEPAMGRAAANDQSAAALATRIRQDGERLDPETITVLDPACGSGHILLEAYEVLKSIYLERGYRLRDIPKLILEKNLFGLDIDRRAIQLAGFALLMKARVDDRGTLSNPPRINLVEIHESDAIDYERIAGPLADAGIDRTKLSRWIACFKEAKTFGSLIQIPWDLKGEVATLIRSLETAKSSGDMYQKAAAEDMLPLAIQALILSMGFDIVVANPPYMGGKGMIPQLRSFALKNYERGKSDLFAMFIERGLVFCKPSGLAGMVTMQSWMFLSSYESLREFVIEQASIDTLIQIGYNSFPELNSKVAQACAFVLARDGDSGVGVYFDLNDAPQSADKDTVFLAKRQARERFEVDLGSFKAIPGSPIAYWVSEKIRGLFAANPNLGSVAKPRQGLASGDNDRFMRSWHEVPFERIGFGYEDYTQAKSSGVKWFPHNKGGEFRKWYGNLDYVLAFDEENFRALSDLGNHLPSRQLYFKEGMSWTALTSGNFNGRYTNHAIFDAKGPVLFANDPGRLQYFMAFCNSAVAISFLKILAPTLDFNQGPVGNLPIRFPDDPEVEKTISTNVDECIAIAKLDWNDKEVSWDFKSAWSGFTRGADLVSAAWKAFSEERFRRIERMRHLEEQNNRLLIDVYGLNDVVQPDVSDSQITLAKPDAEKDAQRLMSYIVGCAVGRYGLERDGLNPQNSGGEDPPDGLEGAFAASKHGIVPVTDEAWFDDDIVARARAFIATAFAPEKAEENFDHFASMLEAGASAGSDDIIRRYMKDRFYKDHLQIYKKKPIYWLFSSGKQGAFQAYVYAHRYAEGTLSRMRSEYVAPLSAKFAGRLEMLSQDLAASGSAAARVKLQKQIESLRKKQTELQTFDEKLRHYADMRISLNTDDGVKANYAKFGDLVAESKAITGGSDD